MSVAYALVSPDDYLSFEASAEVRHEYAAGVVYAMAGASRSHVLVTRNLYRLLLAQLDSGRCETLSQDAKVWIDAANAYYYPDALIACPPNFIGEANAIIDNPTVVFEILSPSTRLLDQSTKFTNYRQLPSLKAYVLVDSESVHVDVYFQEADRWLKRSYERLDEDAMLEWVGVLLSLTALYRGVLPATEKAQ